MRGIKRETLDAFLKRKGRRLSLMELDRRLRNLSEREARDIYREIFFKDAGVEKITHPGLAEQVLDGVVNQGQGAGIRQLQNALNRILGSKLKTDAMIGPRTLQAIDAAVRAGKLRDVRRQVLRERIMKIDALAKPERVKETLRRRARSVGPR